MSKEFNITHTIVLSDELAKIAEAARPSFLEGKDAGNKSALIRRVSAEVRKVHTADKGLLSTTTQVVCAASGELIRDQHVRNVLTK